MAGYATMPDRVYRIPPQYPPTWDHLGSEERFLFDFKTQGPFKDASFQESDSYEDISPQIR